MANKFRRGTSVFVACPSVAGANPTRAEITAGVVIKRIASVTGFQMSNSPSGMPSLDDNFTPTVPGEDTVADSSFTMWDDDTDTDSRDALAKDTQMVMVYMPWGDVPGQRCELWDVTSTGVNDEIDLSAANKFVTGFGVNARPKQTAVIPAL